MEHHRNHHSILSVIRMVLLAVCCTSTDKTEIIEFQHPLETENNLYISKISVSLPEEEASLYVQEELHKAFSRFGLLHSVLPFTCEVSYSNESNITALPPVGESSLPPSHGSTCRLYAFVNFYSKLCARKAKEQLHLTRIVGTTPCKVQFSQRKKNSNKERELLYPSQCFNLANFYLGFDGWSIGIKLMKRDDPVPGADTLNRVCRFLCVVELVIPRHGLTTHGIGTAEGSLATGQEATDKGSVISRCQKTAYREAVRNAFSRVLMVVVGTPAVDGGDGGDGGCGSGKVYAEINTTIPDPYITAECLQDPTILTVNELLEEPREESSEEEKEEANDDEMIQILADLQSESEHGQLSIPPNDKI